MYSNISISTDNEIATVSLFLNRLGGCKADVELCSAAKVTAEKQRNSAAELCRGFSNQIVTKRQYRQEFQNHYNVG